MSELFRTRQLGFKAFVAGGIVIGLVLLAQSVSTYVYVSGNLVIQEALRDATRSRAALERTLRRTDVNQWEEVAILLNESVAQSEERLAWLRLLDSSGGVIARSSEVESAPISFADLRTNGSGENGFYEIRQTAAGEVLVTGFSVRTSGERGQRSAAASNGEDSNRRSTLLEMGINLNTVSEAFLALRRDLIIGVSGALALLATIIFVGLRFPHYLRARQLESQLSLTVQVQSNLLPASTPSHPDVDVSGRCLPAWHVGGDFYDAFEVEGDRLALMLGDVSGKGLPAAPLMGFIHGAAHASTWTRSPADHEEATARLNDLLHKKTSTERFVSLFWGYFDREYGSLHYTNAGHLPPLLVRRGAGDVECIRLDGGGPVLGVLPGARFEQNIVPVEAGDVLVIYSDGILEATNERGEEFGEQRIREVLCSVSNSSANEICDALLSRLADFEGAQCAEDDRTLLVVRFQHVRALPHAEAVEELVAVQAVA